MARISDVDKKELLGLNSKTLTFDVMNDLLGSFEKRVNGKLTNIPPRFNPTDIFTLTPSEYFVDKVTETTVGKFLYNKFIVEYVGLENVLGYVNWAMSSSGINKVDGILAQALLEDKMPISKFKEYINRRTHLGNAMHAVICPSLTMNVIKTPKDIVKEKERLINENREKLESGDIVVAESIEKQLLSKAKDALDGDPAMDIYMSGAQGTFNNNYKNINLLKGPIYNNITGKYDFVESSFIDGIKKKDIPTMGNAVVSGVYPKAVGTQVSGYFAKQILAALQTEVLDDEGSDCGTKRLIDFTITKTNARDFHYRYIQENGKLVELTPDIIPRYYNKTVKLRTPMTCISDKICHRCAGNLFYKLGIRNVGLTSSRVATTLTKLGMKKFHDSTVNAQKIDLGNLLI